MPLVRDVTAALDRIAPTRFALDFDRIGLQVGDSAASVQRCVVSLDRSLGAVEFAKASGAQMLVSHHPLIFQPLATVETGTYEGRTVLALATAGINFAAAHTNWDAARGGISDTLVSIFGLSDVTFFGMVSQPPEQPISRVGTLPCPMTLTEFGRLADEKLQTRSWVWGDPGRRIERVAVAGGAADSDWANAKRQGADVFLVGEVKQHIALEASESGLCIIASGHYATEHPGSSALRDRLAAELPEIEFLLFTPPAGSHGRPA